MRPKELVLAWVEAFNNADADELAAFYVEDAVNHQVAESPFESRNAIYVRRRFRVTGSHASTRVLAGTIRY